jgi:uncharacterized membrane protein YphA (DoxX/SURF4 family)
MAFLSGSGEIVFPVLLVLGLGTRFAALGLLFMTFIVELTVPEGWPIHITWAAMALAIMAWGAWSAVNRPWALSIAGVAYGKSVERLTPGCKVP